MNHPHLTAVPDPPGEDRIGRGENGSNYERRVTRLETHLKYLATKEDIQKLKVWWLIGIISGMAVAVGMAMTFLKLFGSS